MMKQRKWLLTRIRPELKKTPSIVTAGPANDTNQASTYRWEFEVKIALEFDPWPTVVHLRRKPVIVFIIRHVQCCIISLLYV